MPLDHKVGKIKTTKTIFPTFAYVGHNVAEEMALSFGFDLL